MLRTKGAQFVNDELIQFTRHMSSAIGMQLPLGETLGVMAKELHGNAFGKTLQKVKEEIDEGVPLSQALSNHDRFFPEYYTRLVAAGEKGNSLKEIFDQLGGYLDRMFKLHKRIRAALAYPAFVIALILVDIFLLLAIFIMPRIAGIYSELGAELPKVTILILSIGQRFMSILFVFICLLILMVILYFATGLFRSRKGRFIIDRLILNLPLLGVISRRVAAARFTRTLGSLLRGGVPLPEALRLVSDTSSNEVVKQAILEVKKQVEEGEKFGKELSGTEVFPETMVWMIAMGEDKGTLEATLDSLAEYYDTQVESSISIAMAIFEPLVIVIIGIMVAFFVSAIYLPIFSIFNLFTAGSVNYR